MLLCLKCRPCYRVVCVSLKMYGMPPRPTVCLTYNVCTPPPPLYSWSPTVTWHYDAVVQWNGESFKGEGVFNVAIPCDSSQEFFYVRKALQSLYVWYSSDCNTYIVTSISLRVVFIRLQYVHS